MNYEGGRQKGEKSERGKKKKSFRLDKKIKMSQAIMSQN